MQATIDPAIVDNSTDRQIPFVEVCVGIVDHNLPRSMVFTQTSDVDSFSGKKSWRLRRAIRNHNNLMHNDGFQF